MAAFDGLERVLAALNREVEGIKQRRTAGLMAAGLLVQGRSQKRVPVEYGKLRASAYTKMVTPDIVEVGYSAKYARYVHENLEQKLKGIPRPSGLGEYWNPGEPKYLERPFRESKKDILETIRSYSKRS